MVDRRKEGNRTKGLVTKITTKKGVSTKTTTITTTTTTKVLTTTTMTKVGVQTEAPETLTRNRTKGSSQGGSSRRVGDYQEIGTELKTNPEMSPTVKNLPVLVNPLQSKPEIPVGGRLGYYWEVWENMGASPAVVDILKNGLKWKFVKEPRMSNKPWRVQDHINPEKQVAMEGVIEKLLLKGAIEEVTKTDSPGHYSILFLRQKPSGEWRPIIDLKHLNSCIENQTFSMESARSIQEAMDPDQWVISLDLTDAYFHIPINQKFKKYLRFAVLGKTYQFRAMPFGLAIAPRIFTMVMLELAKVLRKHGVIIHMYLDDWLIRNDDPESLASISQGMLTLTDDLGLLVNVPKSELDPTQVAEFVGVLYKLAEGRAFPPLKRVEKIKELINHFLQAEETPAADWLRLIGLLGSVADQVPLGRLHVRPIQYCLAEQWKMSRNLRSEMVIVPEILKDQLKWWNNSDALTVGVPLERFQADLSLFTDASTEGWGAHLEGQEVSGLWRAEKGLHINLLEMKAVSLAVKHFATTLKDKHLLVATDNTTVIAYINHQGGTRSWSLMEETQLLFNLTQSLNIKIRARHIPGRLNVLADRLSRKNQILPTEWSLHPAVLESLWAKWEKPMIDLFATKDNNKLSLYVSPVPDASAIGVDALTTQWKNLYLYAYPPTGLIGQVISKLKTEPCKMVLIAPYWPEKPWFPEILPLQVEPPVLLPLRKDLLKQPHMPVFHKNPQMLNLHAFLLSSMQ